MVSGEHGHFNLLELSKFHAVSGFKKHPKVVEKCQEFHLVLCANRRKAHNYTPSPVLPNRPWPTFAWNSAQNCIVIGEDVPVRQERPGSLVAQIFKLSLPQGQRLTNSEQVDVCLLLECFNPESTHSPSPVQCAPITPRGFSLVLQRSNDKWGLGKVFCFLSLPRNYFEQVHINCGMLLPKTCLELHFQSGKTKKVLI